MLVYVCKPLQDLMAPASDAGFWHQLGSVLHQLIQVAILQVNSGQMMWAGMHAVDHCGQVTNKAACVTWWSKVFTTLC